MIYNVMVLRFRHNKVFSSFLPLTLSAKVSAMNTWCWYQRLTLFDEKSGLKLLLLYNF